MTKARSGRGWSNEYPRNIVSSMILPTRLRSVPTMCLLLACLVWGTSHNRADTRSMQLLNSIPDLSGLAWVEGDTFLAVHDAKNPEENDRPRISLLQLPDSPRGITCKTLSLDWPLPLGLSGDLESIARIPGTDSFLLVESGEGRHGALRFRRVFMIKVGTAQPTLDSFAELPEVFKNIEGSAVARLGDRLLFICAERGDDRTVTEVYWTDLQLRPLRFGSFRKAHFKPAGFSGKNKRPVSAIEVDSLGRVYIASAYDPNDDNGPFKSVIWRAGRIWADRNNEIRLGFHTRPHKLATLDGLKVESLGIREAKGRIELFAGTDDENYGGALRAIPLAQ